MDQWESNNKRLAVPWHGRAELIRWHLVTCETFFWTNAEVFQWGFCATWLWLFPGWEPKTVNTRVKWLSNFQTQTRDKSDFLVKRSISEWQAEIWNQLQGWRSFRMLHRTLKSITGSLYEDTLGQWCQNCIRGSKTMLRLCYAISQGRNRNQT